MRYFWNHYCQTSNSHWQDETPRRDKKSSDNLQEHDRGDSLLHERMPMCVAVCVLLAIVFVLSRTGDGTAPSLPNPNIRSNGHSNNLLDCSECNDCIGILRQKALASTQPHIIECTAAEEGESQAACHLGKVRFIDQIYMARLMSCSFNTISSIQETRYAAVGQKGATIWMTGCSGSGKTTIATALEDKLVKLYGKHVYRLDGDNLRTGLNRDLTFTEADRAESVRRTGEIATLFADAGVITLVGLIRVYRSMRFSLMCL
jgi:ABC-type glutathione transport system ATPase component